MNTDYRKILIAYIFNVANQEGVTFISRVFNRDFFMSPFINEEEFNALKECESEALSKDFKESFEEKRVK